MAQDLAPTVHLLHLIAGVAMGVEAMMGAKCKHLYIGPKHASYLKKGYGWTDLRGKYLMGMKVHVRMNLDEFTVLCTSIPLPDPHPGKPDKIFTVGLKE
jgi:hypothetical protein